MSDEDLEFDDEDLMDDWGDEEEGMVADAPPPKKKSALGSLIKLVVVLAVLGGGGAVGYVKLTGNKLPVDIPVLNALLQPSEPEIIPSQQDQIAAAAGQDAPADTTAPGLTGGDGMGMDGGDMIAATGGDPMSDGMSPMPGETGGMGDMGDMAGDGTGSGGAWGELGLPGGGEEGAPDIAAMDQDMGDMGDMAGDTDVADAGDPLGMPDMDAFGDAGAADDGAEGADPLGMPDMGGMDGGLGMPEMPGEAADAADSMPEMGMGAEDPMAGMDDMMAPPMDVGENVATPASTPSATLEPELPAQAASGQTDADSETGALKEEIAKLNAKITEQQDTIAGLERKLGQAPDSGEIKRLNAKIKEQDDTIARLEKQLDKAMNEAASASAAVSSADAPSGSSVRTAHKAAAAKPEATRPAPAPKWVLKSAKPGIAWVAKEDSPDLKTVEVGQSLTGIGKVLSVAKDEYGRWIVKGSKGSIEQ